MSRKAPNQSYGTVDSAGQAAAVLEIPESVIRLAKKTKSARSCFPGGSRVDCDRLKKWYDKHKHELSKPGQVTKEQADTRLKIARAEKAEFDLLVAKGKYRLAEEVDRDFQRIGTVTTGLLNQKLIVELPPKLAGLGVIEITEALRSALNGALRAIHDRETWQKAQ
jgi:hypothetical protein